MNIIKATFRGGSRFCTTRSVFQIDKGDILKFEGLDLPEYYEVHFSNSKNALAKRVLAIGDSVVIPWEYMRHGQKEVFAWVYITPDAETGYTLYQVTIPLNLRSDVSDVEPTPEQEDIIGQAISALNDGVERAEAAEQHYPRIVDDYWYVWDVETQEWQNTGCKASSSADIFMAKYGVTTQAELDEALHAGKQIYAQNNHTPPTVFTLDNAKFHISEHGDFSYTYTFSHFDETTLNRIQFEEGRWITLADITLANAENIPSLTHYRTAAAQDEIDHARDMEIADVKTYDGILYSGNPSDGQTLFSTQSVSAGDVLYYSLVTSVEQQMGVLLMDSNNNQIGFFGRKHLAIGWLKYEGAIIVPEGFDHAIARVTEAGTVKINYVCKNPSPEMIKTHMSNMLNAYNYSMPYISIGYRLRVSDGKPIQNSKYSITGFYSVLPGDLVCVSHFIEGGNTYGIGCYDANQDYLYGIPMNMEKMTLIVPDGVFYLVYTVLNANEHLAVNIYRGNEIAEKCGHLYNKRCITFGDSLSYWDSKVFNFGRYNGSYCMGYQSYMRRVGMIVTNAGVAGNDATEINPRVKATDFTNYDMVTINCGGNDSKDDVPLGELAPIGSTFDVTTFYGALQDAIEYILGNNPSIQIVLITPLKGTFYPDKEVKTQFVTAFKEIGSLYAIPVCDWHNNSGINKLNFETYINDLPEDHNYLCHPNNAGYQRIANIFIPFLKSLYTDSIYLSQRSS